MKRFVLVLCLVTALCSVNVFAGTANYGFSFSSAAVGSLKFSTGSNASGITPYVYPDHSTVTVNYALVTQPNTTNRATNICQINNRLKKSFTWNSGAGALGITYYLSGYPDSSVWPWQPFTVTGVWAD